MKSESLDMTKGPLNKQILLFSVPLILSNLIQVLFNMADVAVVGRFAGAEALGSVGSTTTLVVLFTGFLMGIGGGVNAVTALFFGARADKDVEETVHTAALLCLIFGIAISIIGITMAGVFLRLLNTKDELIEGAILYVRIYFIGIPALALYDFGNGVFSAIGNTKRPLYYLSVSGILNVILNLFFVIVLKLNVAGVALASVISMYLAAFLIIRALVKSPGMYAFKPRNMRLVKDKAQRICGVGIPSGLQNAIFQLANLFVQGGVNSFDAVVVEGNSAAANADGIVYTAMASFYTACTSFMSQNYGARIKKRILRSYFASMVYSFAIGAILGISLFLLGRPFLHLFASEEEVIYAGMKRLTVMGFSYAISAFMDCTIAASRGLGKTGVPTIIVILGSCVFRIAWIYTIFAHYHTIESLYLLYAFSWTITAVFEILYFNRIWKKVRAGLA